MIKRSKSSKRELYNLGRELGYKSASEVVDVLRVNGIEGKFDPSRMGEYVAIITAHARTLTSILNKLDSGTARKGERDSKRLITSRNDPEKVLRAYGQRPWLIKPVAIDERGRYHSVETRDLPKGWTLSYDGVTKQEHLDAIEKEKVDEPVGT